VDTGPGVTTVRVGQRITVNPCLICGECAWCRRGEPNYCAKLGSIGLSRDGALAPLVAVPEYGCHVLPDDIDDTAAATVEPLAVVLHAWRRARLGTSTSEPRNRGDAPVPSADAARGGGESVVVIGGGAIGLMLVQVLRAKGAGWIGVVEPRADRRSLAEALGADAVIDPEAGDPGRAVARLTGQERAAVAFECVGSPVAFATAVRAAGKGGRIVLVGLVAETVQVNLLGLLAHEKEIVGSSAYTDEFPVAIALLVDGRVRIEPLVTATVPLEAVIPRGLEALRRREEAHVKIMVTPE
jgi:(R,R)-butanediol dehydrogenase/meso-butanediol dehydrogenase/diacetyl reductase